MEKETEIPREAKKFFTNLIHARFDKVFDDKEEYLQFMTFVKNRALDAGGFAISVPQEEGGLMWLFYEINNVQTKRDRINYQYFGIQAYVPDDEKDRTMPEEIEGFPVWWIDPDKEIK